MRFVLKTVKLKGNLLNKEKENIFIIELKDPLSMFQSIKSIYKKLF